MLRAAVAHHYESQCETVVFHCAYLMLHAKSYQALHLAFAPLTPRLDLGFPQPPLLQNATLFTYGNPQNSVILTLFALRKPSERLDYPGGHAEASERA